MPVFAVSMATEFTVADLELARTVRADIEQRGGYSRPNGEFRKRIAAAGISLNSTASSKLWRAADQEAASGSETGGGSEEEANDGVTPELEDEDQGLTFEEISASHFGPLQDDETLGDYEERVSRFSVSPAFRLRQDGKSHVASIAAGALLFGDEADGPYCVAGQDSAERYGSQDQ